MFFIILVFGAALTLESLGSFISVVGLSAKASMILLVLAVVLDFCKVMIASVLYKRWKDLHLLLRVILVPTLLFLITLTSTGTNAFLIQEFSKTTAGQDQLKEKIGLLEAEQTKLQKRKEEIDGQIAQLPPESVVQRKRLTELFSKESSYINDRLMTLSKEIPQDKIQIMQDTDHSGTLGSIASAYGVEPDKISRILAFFIALVIDPLAIVLLTVANFLVEQRQKAKNALQAAGQNLVNPWDKFRKVLFGKKYVAQKLAQQGIITPYTDSTGHLLKETIFLDAEHFVISAEFTTPEVAQLTFDTIHSEREISLTDFVTIQPALVKENRFLIAQKIIQTVDLVEPVIEKALNKSLDYFLTSENELAEYTEKMLVTEKKNETLHAQSILENVVLLAPQKGLVQSESVHLKAHSLIGNVELMDEIPQKMVVNADVIYPQTHSYLGAVHADLHIVSRQHEIEHETIHIPALHEVKLAHTPDTIETFTQDRIEEDTELISEMSQQIPDENNASMQETVASEPVMDIGHDNQKPARPRPQTLPQYRMKSQEGGFFNGEEPVRFIPSNCPEDLVYFDNDIAYWDNDDDYFNIDARDVMPIIINGFDLRKVLGL